MPALGVVSARKKKVMKRTEIGFKDGKYIGAMCATDELTDSDLLGKRTSRAGRRR
jgi:hypothetical protein